MAKIKIKCKNPQMDVKPYKLQSMDVSNGVLTLTDSDGNVFTADLPQQEMGPHIVSAISTATTLVLRPYGSNSSHDDIVFMPAAEPDGLPVVLWKYISGEVRDFTSDGLYLPDKRQATHNNETYVTELEVFAYDKPSDDKSRRRLHGTIFVDGSGQLLAAYGDEEIIKYTGDFYILLWLGAGGKKPVYDVFIKQTTYTAPEASVVRTVSPP